MFHVKQRLRKLSVNPIAKRRHSNATIQPGTYTGKPAMPNRLQEDRGLNRPGKRVPPSACPARENPQTTEISPTEPARTPAPCLPLWPRGALWQLPLTG